MTSLQAPMTSLSACCPLVTSRLLKDTDPVLVLECLGDVIEPLDQALPAERVDRKILLQAIVITYLAGLQVHRQLVITAGRIGKKLVNKRWKELD